MYTTFSNQNLLRTFSTNKGKVMYEISYLDFTEPTVTAAQVILNEATANRKCYSMNKALRKSKRFQQWCNKALLDYLQLSREKLFADTHGEIFGDSSEEGELYSVTGKNYEA